MKSIKILVAAALLLISGKLAAAQEVVWTLEGLDAPESVFFDDARGIFYVSNIGGEPNAKDGNGYISRVSSDGALLEAQWVTGLDAPKGLISDGSTLYVSDIDRLVAVDIKTAEISGTWLAEGAIFLNDPTIDGTGRIYVSDMITNKIHVLEDDALSVFVEGDTLQHPNGLNISDNMLIVAGWGKGLKEDFSTETGGNLLTVDLETGAVANLGSGEPIGNLDGLEPDGKGSWIVSDWIAGRIYRIAADGSADMLLELKMGSADLEYLPDRSLLIVPMMLDNTLVAYLIE